MVYMDDIYRRLANKDPECPLEELTEILTKTIYMRLQWKLTHIPSLITNAALVACPKTVGMMRNAER